MTQKRLLSASDVAELFGVDAKAVRKWVDEGLLAAGRTLGGGHGHGHLRFEPAVVAAALTRQGLSVPHDLRQAVLRAAEGEPVDPSTGAV